RKLEEPSPAWPDYCSGSFGAAHCSCPHNENLLGNPVPLGLSHIEPCYAPARLAQVRIEGFRSDKDKEGPILKADTPCLRGLAQGHGSDQIRATTMRALDGNGGGDMGGTLVGLDRVLRWPRREGYSRLAQLHSFRAWGYLGVFGLLKGGIFYSIPGSAAVPAHVKGVFDRLATLRALPHEAHPTKGETGPDATLRGVSPPTQQDTIVEPVRQGLSISGRFKGPSDAKSRIFSRWRSTRARSVPP